MPKDDPLGLKKKPLMDCEAYGGRHFHTLLQPSHPTRIVAWVGIVKHTSAYKRNPLFGQWVPALITSTLIGFLITQIRAMRNPIRVEYLN